MSSNYKIHTTLTRKTSVTLNISEHIVDEVIAFQWREAHEASKNFSTIELSNMGYFRVRPGMLQRKIALHEKYVKYFEEKLSTTAPDDPDHYRITVKLNKNLSDLEYLRSKQDGSLTDTYEQD